MKCAKKYNKSWRPVYPNDVRQGDGATIIHYCKDQLVKLKCDHLTNNRFKFMYT